MINFKDFYLNEINSQMGYFNYNNKNEYKMYFDEKGEKKIYVTDEGGINQKVINQQSTELGLFVLGGIAFKKDNNVFNTVDNNSELKGSKFRGDFFNVICDKEIGKILNHLRGKCYIHFFVTDFCSFILEDITFNLFRNKLKLGIEYAKVKSVFEDFFRMNYNLNDLMQLEVPVLRVKFINEFFENFLKKTPFTNTKEEKEVRNEILKLKGDYSNIIANFSYDNYYLEYIKQCSNFSLHSKLIFDNEQYAEKHLKEYVETSNDKTFEKINLLNVEFCDSKTDINIQYSDIVVMLIYKLVTELKKYKSYNEYHSQNKELLTKRNYRLLMKILNDSVNENDNFFGSFINYNDRILLETIIMKGK